MKLKINLENTNIKRRIEQFQKYKTDGEIVLEKHSDCFLKFSKGRVSGCSFLGETDSDRVIESFIKLKTGTICIDVRGKNSFEFDLKKIPYMTDHAVFDDELNLIYGNDKIKKSALILINSTLKNQEIKTKVIFVRGSKKCFALYRLKKGYIFFLFEAKANYLLITKKLNQIIDE